MTSKDKEKILNKKDGLIVRLVPYSVIKNGPEKVTVVP
jgi:hypothetical protein